jgi:hypothetical protein
MEVQVHQYSHRNLFRACTALCKLCNRRKLTSYKPNQLCIESDKFDLIVIDKRLQPHKLVK